MTYHRILQQIRTESDLTYREAQHEASIAYRASKAHDDAKKKQKKKERKKMTPKEVNHLAKAVTDEQEKLKQLVKKEKFEAELLKLQKQTEELRRNPTRNGIMTLARDTWRFFRRVMEKMLVENLNTTMIIALALMMFKVTSHTLTQTSEFITRHEETIGDALFAVRVKDYASMAKSFTQIMVPLLMIFFKQS